MNEQQTFRPKARQDEGQTHYKRRLGYAYLGIDPMDVEHVPFFAAELRRIARVVRGVDKRNPPAPPVRPLELLLSSEDPEGRKVADAYLSVPESYRKLLPLEAYCKAVCVSPWRVLESITVVAVRQGALSCAIIAAVLHPRVVVKTVERALQNDGVRDRMMLHKAVGFTPPRF